MTFPFHKGRLTARLAQDDADVRACQALRQRSFFDADGYDADPFDDLFQHLMIVDDCDTVVGALRFRVCHTGADMQHGYVAQHYDLRGWGQVAGPFLEVGRFCTVPGMDADLLRMLWAALTRLVDTHRVTMLFGCTSFAGTDPTRYGAVFHQLARRHQGPVALRPGVSHPMAVRFADVAQTGIAPMPALLKSYLSLGGWVGDHAVVDPAMKTLHVFTCLQVSAMSAARAARLRAVAS